MQRRFVSHSLSICYWQASAGEGGTGECHFWVLSPPCHAGRHLFGTPPPLLAPVSLPCPNVLSWSCRGWQACPGPGVPCSFLKPVGLPWPWIFLLCYCNQWASPADVFSCCPLWLTRFPQLCWSWQAGIVNIGETPMTAGFGGQGGLYCWAPRD